MDQASKTAGQAEEGDGSPYDYVGSIWEGDPACVRNFIDAQIAIGEVSMNIKFAQLKRHMESQVQERDRSIKELETRVRMLESQNANYSSNIKSTQEAYKKLASECEYYKAQSHQLANTLGTGIPVYKDPAGDLGKSEDVNTIIVLISRKGQNNDTTMVID
ncbi:MAG: hypothetical protein Q9179_006735 [Wetmoreana sp. 5 TL-2023]